MVYDMIRAQMAQSIPFARSIGTNIVSIGDGVSEVTMELKPELMNHIQTAHAGAIFTLAETASGAAMAGALAPHMLEVRPVATVANIEYLKTGKTKLTAYGKTDGVPAELRETLKSESKVVFDVLVDVRDEDNNEISRVKVTWHVAIKR